MFYPDVLNKFLEESAPVGGYTRYDIPQVKTCYYLNQYTRKIIEYCTDSTKLIIHKYEYENPLSNKQVSDLNKGIPLNLAKDDKCNHCMFFYDNSNQLVGSRSSQGYVTEFRYDKDGNLMQQTQFAKKARFLEDFEELIKDASQTTEDMMTYTYSSHDLDYPSYAYKS